MKLITKAIRETLPPLCSQDGLGGKAIAYVKLFMPSNSWTFFVTEFDGRDLFFGLVEGHEKELGYFSLSELQSVKGPLGLPIERDLYWRPQRLDQIAPVWETPAPMASPGRPHRGSAGCHLCGRCLVHRAAYAHHYAPFGCLTQDRCTHRQAEDRPPIRYTL